ncbi:hypothetical protein Vadar_010971 [Vaccinium darrowii]|uniref:Uncharacterized protein n=1 Tax=Vaccinium darrowii TaxID=229202 RepID=A0ACB7XGU1_9ERIC|nr:hypothetical protein Vadar_010971 [Vaccinium darrowii]
MSSQRERYDDEIVGKKMMKRDYLDAASSYCYDHHHDQMVGRRYNMVEPPAAAAAAGTLNTITPCAACKLLRRRCAQECPFSPYFSPHQPHKFASVHKVFGASNVSKLLMKVPESQRADAANSLVYEAIVRIRDPVYGCMGAISTLQQEVQYLQAELDLVRAEVMKFKYRENNTLVPSDYHLSLLSSGAVSIAAPPLVQPSLPPLPPLPPHPPITSSSSSFYTPILNASAYSSTISKENVPYFG